MKAKAAEPDPFIWYKFLDDLAGGDITKYEAIEEMNYIHYLNVVAMRIIKAKNK